MYNVPRVLRQAFSKYKLDRGAITLKDLAKLKSDKRAVNKSNKKAEIEKQKSTQRQVNVVVKKLKLQEIQNKHQKKKDELIKSVHDSRPSIKLSRAASAPRGGSMIMTAEKTAK